MNVLNATRLSLVAALSLSGLAHADPVSLSFSDNFEQTLASAWTDRSPSNREGGQFNDPLREGNHVLGFNRLGAGGSVFGKTVVSGPTSIFTLTFDYLGMPGRGGVAGDLGGYIGVAADGYENTIGYWIGGTGSHLTPIALIDDGQWHSYSFTWTSGIGNRLRVMAEDWAGSGGVAGDAFFDNIVLTNGTTPNNVPEPGSLALVVLGLAAATAGKWRHARRQA